MFHCPGETMNCYKTKITPLTRGKRGGSACKENDEGILQIWRLGGLGVSAERALGEIVVEAVCSYALILGPVMSLRLPVCIRPVRLDPSDEASCETVLE